MTTNAVPAATVPSLPTRRSLLWTVTILLHALSLRQLRRGRSDVAHG